MVATLAQVAATDYPTPAEYDGLLARAIRRGVRISGPADRPVAYDPAARSAYQLTAASCTCRFFVNVGVCQHLALWESQQTPA